MEDNLFELHNQLRNKTYRHSNYSTFNICDPKMRKINKAIVVDRVLHHAVFRILYTIFDSNFIFDSYSCRTEKGTHRAVKRLEKFCRKLSQNNHKIIYALKCDIRKFFDSIDQNILLEAIKTKIQDENALWLIDKIIRSFEIEKNKGLPLGNVTSQLFANIYLNELDQFIKHKLKVKYYLRYSDDFVILSDDKLYLKKLVFEISNFLKIRLKLFLHPDKVEIRKFSRGIDFLGYVVLPHYIALRTKTKKRIFKKISKKYEDLKNKKISEKSFEQSLQSYLGILKHCKGNVIERKIKNSIIS
ncbi:MAG: Retron-type reverse transcriptase [Candidatus Moranbacteria bacterium GW2011_GWF2_36_839]|nr:MAG: Retron-type reverse transcriptase [Candidatus Moranbacteria bacterium GW2011_GWF1_36_78]KKQ17606.1 MAG: Retron-type reverse transcriptase [Candidatus Moranbacteria bacterium GW2011_GWF2_36_839]